MGLLAAKGGTPRVYTRPRAYLVVGCCEFKPVVDIRPAVERMGTADAGFVACELSPSGALRLRRRLAAPILSTAWAASERRARTPRPVSRRHVARVGGLGSVQRKHLRRPFGPTPGILAL